jgi:hypothetical protein
MFLKRLTSLINLRDRYALAARLEARWPILVAAGISVGFGAFALFVCTRLED